MKPPIPTNRLALADFNAAAELLRTIAEPATLKVLAHLKRQSQSVTTIARDAGLNPGQVSHVLFELHEAGLAIASAKHWYQLTDRGRAAGDLVWRLLAT